MWRIIIKLNRKLQWEWHTQNEDGKLRPDWGFKLWDFTKVVNTGVICQVRSLRKKSLDNLWGRQMFCTWESGSKVLLALQEHGEEINVKGLLDSGHFSCPATPVQLLPLMCCSKDKHRSGEDSSVRWESTAKGALSANPLKVRGESKLCQRGIWTDLSLCCS